MQETNSREIVVGGQSIICRELTVLQVRNWLKDTALETDPFEAMLFTDCTLGDIKRMTSLTDEMIDAMRPSQVDEVISVCKELNPHFFGLLGRLTMVVQQARC